MSTIYPALSANEMTLWNQQQAPLPMAVPAKYHAVPMKETEAFTQATHEDNFSNISAQNGPFYTVYVSKLAGDHCFDYSHYLTQVIKKTEGCVAGESRIEDPFKRGLNDIRDTRCIYVLPTKQWNDNYTRLIPIEPKEEQNFESLESYFHFELFSNEELAKHYPVFETVLHHHLIVDNDESKLVVEEKMLFIKILMYAAKLLYSKIEDISDKILKLDLVKKVFYFMKSAMHISNQARSWFGAQCKKNDSLRCLKIDSLRRKALDLELSAVEKQSHIKNEPTSRHKKSSRHHRAYHKIEHRNKNSCVHQVLR